MRRLIAFDCAGDTLIGTFDEAAGRTGLLIVSGGNELRSGAHRGMAMLAARLAATGVPVFRYDRRGVGDSTGDNHGFASSGPDIATAVRAFRTVTPLDRIVAFGNCDGASALALFGRDAGVDAVVLANPWVVEAIDDLPPAAAIRARYAAKLRDPAEWGRLLGGGVSILNVARGLVRIATPATDGDLAARVLRAIVGWGEAATIVLARGDATAIAYADRAARTGIDPQTLRLDTASHSFARHMDGAALEAAILTVLHDIDGRDSS